jgi:hypothetical protein
MYTTGKVSSEGPDEVALQRALYGWWEEALLVLGRQSLVIGKLL